MTRNAYAKWAGPGLVLLANLVMLLWFWGRAPDPIIDFGREIYMPWRITEGQQLYRDFTYFNGPFSPYFNALVFKIFGVSLETLTITNLVLAMAMTALLYRMLVEIGDRWSATIALVLAPFAFTFAQLNGVPNFNWITPYSHDLTHGIMLGMAMIACVWMYTRRRKVGWIVGAGFLLGLAFLTKAEVFLAAFLAAIAGVLLTMCSDAQPRRRWIALGAFVASGLVPPIVAFALLRAIVPTHEVVLALEGSWRWLGNQQLLNLRYFKLINGTDHLGQSIGTTVFWAGGYLLGAAIVIAIAMNIKAPTQKRRAIGIITAVVLFGVLWLFWLQFNWWNLFRPLQIFMAIGALYYAWQIVRERKAKESLARYALPMMLFIFAGALLAKILWNVRAVHYGFALTLPAAVLAINGIVHFASERAKARGGSPEFVRGVAVALILIACWGHFRADFEFFRKKQFVVAGGSDGFLADIRGKMIDDACNYIIQNTRPDQTLLAMPEGFLMNYLARRVNPTIYHQFTPPNLIMYGEENMLAEMKAHPPDVIALVHVDNIEYDARFLGKDYGLKIWDWVTTNYTPMVKPDGQTALFGYPPFVDAHSGVLLVQRKQ